MTNKKTSEGHSDLYSPIVRWSPSFAELPALSVRQPWAWLIVNGLKDIENRPRRPDNDRVVTFVSRVAATSTVRDKASGGGEENGDGG